MLEEFKLETFLAYYVVGVHSPSCSLNVSLKDEVEWRGADGIQVEVYPRMS